MQKAKRLRVFAGPNGSGKSTIFSSFQKKYDPGYFINADKIEKQLGSAGFIDLEALGIKATEIVQASNNIYSSGGKPVGHAFIQIPVKHINDISVDLHSQDEVSNLINKTIFEMAAKAKLTIRLIFAEENITTFLRIQPNEPIIYIEEVLFNAREEGLARCKLYFLPDKYEISLSI